MEKFLYRQEKKVKEKKLDTDLKVIPENNEFPVEIISKEVDEKAIFRSIVEHGFGKEWCNRVDLAEACGIAKEGISSIHYNSGHKDFLDNNSEMRKCISKDGRLRNQIVYNRKAQAYILSLLTTEETTIITRNQADIEFWERERVIIDGKVWISVKGTAKAYGVKTGTISYHIRKNSDTFNDHIIDQKALLKKLKVLSSREKMSQLKIWLDKFAFYKIGTLLNSSPITDPIKAYQTQLEEREIEGKYGLIKKIETDIKLLLEDKKETKEKIGELYNELVDTKNFICNLMIIVSDSGQKDLIEKIGRFPKYLKKIEELNNKYWDFSQKCFEDAKRKRINAHPRKDWYKTPESKLGFEDLYDFYLEFYMIPEVSSFVKISPRGKILDVISEEEIENKDDFIGDHIIIDSYSLEYDKIDYKKFYTPKTDRHIIIPIKKKNHVKGDRTLEEINEIRSQNNLPVIKL